MSSTAQLLHLDVRNDWGIPVALGDTEEENEGIGLVPVYVISKGNRAHDARAVRIGRLVHEGEDWRAEPGISDEALQGKTFQQERDAATAMYDWWKSMTDAWANG